MAHDFISNTPIAAVETVPAAQAHIAETSTPAPSGRITASLVPENQRLQFLPRHLGRHMLLGEATVYGFMRRLCRNYDGGFWEFIELSNGGFYMRLRSALTMTIEVDMGNDYSGTMSADAASIVACLFTFSHLSCGGVGGLSEAYLLLLDFAAEHEECAEILRAID